MTRRDIIILAVLVNAGLLAILFMLAINTDDDKVSEAIEVSQPIVLVQEHEKTLDLIPTAHETQILAERTGDEVDNALKDFADSPPTQQPMIVEEEVLPYATQENDGTPSSEPSIPEQIVPEQPKDNTKYVEVTVKKGDVLEKIARANGTTVSAIKEANQLKNERLSIGQVLRVPVSTNKKNETNTNAKSNAKKSSSESTSSTKSTPSKSSAKADSKTDSKSEPQYYTVKNGDNPTKIAKQFNVKVDELLKLNNMSEDKARNLKVGDKIRVK
jgi:peptidoglycan endopeptidase LytF